jgi:nucleotide-binding universal stress UspA family protein
MFDTVVIAVDGREGGRDAIALAWQLAVPSAGLTLVHIFGSDWLLGRGMTEQMSLERAEARALLERERHGSGVTAELIVAGDRPVGAGLQQLATQRGADLLVIGACHRAPLGRVLLGDDTHAALNGTPCAVAVAPHGYARTGGQLNTIGVGYDGSQQSEQALAAAITLSKSHDAEVRARWVVSLEEVSDAHPIPADWQRSAAELVNDRARRMAALEGAHGEAVYGSPREELEHMSRGVDLLVLGSRGYGPFERLFHGSVSGHVLRHAACPVLVLPRRTGASPESRIAVDADGLVTAGELSGGRLQAGAGTRA